MSPPIRLLDYFVEQLVYDVNPRLLEEASGEADKDSIAFQADWLSSDEEVEEESSEKSSTEKVVVHLSISVNTGEEEFAQRYYRIEVRLAGLFERDKLEEMENAPSESEYTKHCVASGISTLYGAAREILSSLTAVSPFPKFVLPSIVPYAIANHAVEEAQKETSREEA